MSLKHVDRLVASVPEIEDRSRPTVGGPVS